MFRSLVSRPFQPHHLQFAKIEREGLEDLVTFMMSGRQEVDVRGVGGPDPLPHPSILPPSADCEQLE